MSLIEKAIKEVNIQKLYEHILNIEKIKNPLDNMDNLNECGEYIENQFQSYGLKPNRQEFSLDTFDDPFFNVEAYIPSLDSFKKSENSLLVTSHYDTVYTSPGADDNGTGIAAMLEVARVLKKIGYENDVGFVSFSLEENSARLIKKVRQIGDKLKVYDDQYRFKSLNMLNSQKLYYKRLNESRAKFGFLEEEFWMKFSDEIKGILKPKEFQFFDEVNNFFKSEFKEDFLGDFALLGSFHYAKNAYDNKYKINGLFNLETIGYISSEPFSQKFPPGFNYDLFNKHKINVEQTVGDFITVLPDANSMRIAEEFQKWSENEIIDLPCASLKVPLEFKTIVDSLPDLLRSDHAPFWKFGYPALFITDSANFRNPHYHTMSDTIDTLDFEFIKKVCQATIATIISLQNKE